MLSEIKAGRAHLWILIKFSENKNSEMQFQTWHRTHCKESLQLWHLCFFLQVISSSGSVTLPDSQGTTGPDGGSWFKVMSLEYSGRCKWKDRSMSWLWTSSNLPSKIQKLVFSIKNRMPMCMEKFKQTNKQTKCPKTFNSDLGQNILNWSECNS